MPIPGSIGIGDGRSCRNTGDFSHSNGPRGYSKSLSLYDYGLYWRKLVGSEKAQGAIFIYRPTILYTVSLTEGISHAHDHSAFNLAFQGKRINGFSYAVGCNHLLYFSRVFIENAELCCVSISHMGDRVWQVGAKLICLSKVLCIEFLSFQFLQGPFFCLLLQ